jgi:hypothetical protein
MVPTPQIYSYNRNHKSEIQAICADTHCALTQENTFLFSFPFFFFFCLAAHYIILHIFCRRSRSVSSQLWQESFSSDIFEEARNGTKSLQQKIITTETTFCWTLVFLKSYIFWDITLRSPLKVDWRFEWTHRLYLQGRRINQARNQREAGSKQRFTLAYSSTLKIEAICSFETFVHFQRTTRSYIPEDRNVHSHRCENVELYILFYRPLPQ